MRALGAFALLTAIGCVHPLAGLSERRVLTTKAGEFEVAFAPEQAIDEQRTERSLQRSSEGLFRWGTLEHRVSVFLLASHPLLEAAVHQYDYDWLRAWARYDEVFLQTPSSWAGAGPNATELDELVLHELTHCLMFQLAATKESWLSKEIPLWFREGMATWTANQGYKWPTLEDLARFYEQNPGADPVRSPDGLYQHSNAVVYGAAHHAFTFLIRSQGQEAVHRILAGMHQGRTFSKAFEATTGITVEAFAADFRHYVLWRGFRDGRRIQSQSR
jgi:hypothetical protein